ncbi:BLUF domain-containing protein [Azonexus sp. IMCC34839]|uniref:BLUF domain-containing protein n=1 Tax=Azonexus sp. IMCC34839 TaxID=3133695 RepID=UPI00399A959E
MPLVQLIYVSSAKQELTEAELDAILESSVRGNTPLQVTGLLLYSHGSFMQVLEGESAAVDEVYRRICDDPRHHHLIEILREEIGEREFGRWAMGFRRLRREDAGRHEAFLPLYIKGFDAEALQAKPGNALELLHHFALR